MLMSHRNSRMLERQEMMTYLAFWFLPVSCLQQFGATVALILAPGRDHGMCVNAPPFHRVCRDVGTSAVSAVCKVLHHHRDFPHPQGHRCGMKTRRHTIFTTMRPGPLNGRSRMTSWARCGGLDRGASSWRGVVRTVERCPHAATLPSRSHLTSSTERAGWTIAGTPGRDQGR